MAGARVAAPLQALRQGHPAWVVGLLLSLFAVAPIALALPAGRLADRAGYHPPLRIAVALAVAGAAIAAVSGHLAALAAAALLTGAGANIGLIAIQRTAGRVALDAVDRVRVFGWLGMAPALSNVVGPLAAGALIDLGGFRVAFGALMLLPLAGLACARAVPVEVPPPRADAAAGPRPRAAELLGLAPLRSLLLVNWLASASWDVHTFVLPLLGHARGLSASAIGFVLGTFAAAVAAVRFAIPLLAHRVREPTVLRGALLATAAVFAVYPLTRSAASMAACAAALGLALGAVQPMIMTALHRVTPAHRHGEAIALRSMAINLSSTLMPLAFGLGGSAFGAGALFWGMAAIVAAGSRRVSRLA